MHKSVKKKMVGQTRRSRFSKKKKGALTTRGSVSCKRGQSVESCVTGGGGWKGLPGALGVGDGGL